MRESNVPWWIELTEAEWQPEFSNCATCGESADSVDVVCGKDDTVLVDRPTSERRITVAAHVLRALVVLAALAVGYLGWAWPAYAVGVILAFSFALLFFRNHRTAFIYLANVGGVAAASHGLWAALQYPYLADVTWGLTVTAIASSLVFIIGFSLFVSNDGAFPQLSIAVQTASVVSTGIVIVCVGVLIVGLGSVFAHVVPTWVTWGAKHATPFAASVVIFAALVSSIAYTLAAPVFDVKNILHFHEVLKPIRLGRIRTPDYARVTRGVERLAVTAERVLIGFANGITSAIEVAYNRQWCRLVNGLAEMLIKAANAIYKWFVKCARHVARVGERFYSVVIACAQWSWALAKRFAAAFVLPVVLAWLACAELWWIAAEVRRYVLHESSWATPLASLLRIIVVVLLLSASAKLMLQVPATAFGGKLAAAAGAVGGRAFLFFVFIAWTLGLLGWITNGPFRIGWLTLTSTGIVVVSLLALRARRGVAAVPA